MAGIEERLRLRVGTIAVVVALLFGVLLVRLWFLQVLAGERFAAASERNSVRIVSIEAPRGRILDRNGRVIVDNRAALAVGVRPEYLPDDQRDAHAVKRRLAALLGVSVEHIDRALADPKRAPFEPAIVAHDVDEEVVLTIRERRTTDFPGVETMALPVRRYPHGRVASHVLGYVGEINETELAERPGYRLGDSIGRTGVERSYEEVLRGTPGLQKLEVDATGKVLRVLSDPAQNQPVPGKDLVLAIDLRVQKAAERALRDGMAKARTQRFHETGAYFEAPAGALVALDVRTGEVIALASMPTYDVRRFVGGVDQEYWASLHDPAAHNPLLNRAVQTSYPPGSTYKPIIATAALQVGAATPGGRYPCQTAFEFGGTIFRNWQPRDASISLEQSLVESCDTVYYNFARNWWLEEQDQIDAGREPAEIMARWSRRFGLGQPTGIDLPQEAAGRVPDRAWRRGMWEANKEEFCAQYERSPSIVYEDLCLRGFVWRGGDAVNMSIGQGDLEASPLQMAVVYAALANGGRVVEPHVARTIAEPDGPVIERIGRKVRGRIRTDGWVRRYVARALGEVASRGTGEFPYRGWPLDQIPVAAKTGSAEISGRQPFSWFATYGPLERPRYAVVAVVEQAGFGSQIAGPVARRVMDELFGLEPLPIVYGGARSD